MNFKPMLSASLDGVDLATLRYPLFLSPKLDGVRCIVWEGVAYSRNAKPIRNRFVQKWAADHHNIDGELIVGPPVPVDGDEVLGRTQSGVMSFEGEPDFRFHLFDCIESDYPGFRLRLEHVQMEMRGANRIQMVPHEIVHGAKALQELESICLDGGFEGVMLRDPDGPYKHGRSTLREGYLMKLKRFLDGEAVVIRLEESMHNGNEATTDELGRTKRSKHQENLTGNGMVGTLICRDARWGEIRVSPGKMTHDERFHWWQAHLNKDRYQLIGKTIHWRSFGYGTKDAPRHARFYGFREDL